MRPGELAGFTGAGLSQLGRVLARASGRCLHCRAAAAAHLCDGCFARVPVPLLEAVGRGGATALDCVRWLEDLDAEASRINERNHKCTPPEES